MSENIKKNILEVITSCQNALLSTFSLNDYPESRTIANMMNISKINYDDPALYYMTNINSHKVEQIKNNVNVSLYYCNLDTRHTITLFGSIEIITDIKNKTKFWQDNWINFGYKNKEDINYCILKFTPKLYKFYISGQEYSGDL